MNDIFSKSAQKFLADFCKSDILFVFDFDGTLAPIVKDPAKAKMRLTTKRLLDRLIKLYPVAILSGREQMDLEKIVTSTPQFLLGNSGNREGVLPADTLKSQENICKQWLIQLSAIEKKYQGVVIENKNYSIAVHFRNSRERDFCRVELYKFLNSITPFPQIVQGKCVLNLVPASSKNKGDALLSLTKDLRDTNIFYIGDDTTDEDVFALDIERLCSVHVGEKKASSAKFFIRNQKQIDALLKSILMHLEKDE